ncbi:MAG: hypothetical protein ACPL4E_04420 [Thermoproteota archaeon]
MSSARRRFIESISYLRKLGFFEDYSNLTDEEIFEKMREKSIILKNLKEDDWMNESTFEIDRFLVVHDSKRIWGRDLEFGYHPSPEDEVRILMEFAQISKGIFQPTDIKWGRDNWKRPGVHFTFNGRRYFVGYCYYHGGDFLDLGHLLSQLNAVIKETGYQYYLIGGTGQFAFVVVLTLGEAEKLRKERGWELYVY